MNLNCCPDGRTEQKPPNADFLKSKKEKKQQNIRKGLLWNEFMALFGYEKVKRC